MNSTTLSYLDAVSFPAACFIFPHPLNDWSGDGRPVFAPMQSQAIIVFFVLSGFAIRPVVDTKEGRLADYTVSRLARIYSGYADTVLNSTRYVLTDKQAVGTPAEQDWSYTRSTGLAGSRRR